MAPRRHTSAGLGPRPLVLACTLASGLAAACVGGSGAGSRPVGPAPTTLVGKTGVEEPVRREPPISLTAADGAALPLQALHVRAVLDQPLAFTELELVFANPEGRSLEGRLALAIPPGARVTRFAVFRDGDWQEAEVVPRRAAFQQLGLGREPQEPQLVGAPEGERFVARVEPIAAREPTRLIVSYVQEMRGRSEPYRVPLAGLEPLRELGVKLKARGAVVVGGDPAFARIRGDGELVRIGDVSPTDDLIVQPQELRELGLRHDNMVVARISPIHHDHPDPIESLAILFDTSASQALGWDTHVDRLAQLIAEVGARVLDDVPLRVICFDQGVELAYEGTLRKFDADALAAIRARRPLGASNLAGALRFAAGVGDKPAKRLVLMTDGLMTAGATSEAALAAEVARLREVGVGRVDVIVEGGAADPALLRTFTALTNASPERPGLVLRSGVTPRVAALRMTRTVVRGVEVQVPGSEWVYPQQLDAVQAGDYVLVYADVAGDDGGDSLAVNLVGPEVSPRHDIALRASPSPLLADAWAGARAAWLIDQARTCDRGVDETCDRWRERAAEFSLARRIVNDTTTMVVLGSAGDYPRFGLDGARPRDVLSVGSFGVEMRPAAPLPSIADGAAAPRPHALLAGLRMASPDWDERPTKSESRPKAHSMPARPTRSRRPGPSRPVRKTSEPVAAEPQRAPLDKDAGLHFGPRRTPEDAYEGNFLAVMNLLAAWDDKQNALGVAQRWQKARPADVTALLALGEALEANGRPDVAARAYGSLIDLYPGRPEIRRLAAERLERTGDVAGWLVLDSYSRAVEQRYDDPAGYRLYAYALLRAGYFAEAWAALVDGLAWARVGQKTRGLEQVLKGDLGLVAAAWIRRWPDQRDYVMEALRVEEAELATAPSLRFVLSWDNEHADVDLHVRDGHGWHAFYRHKQLDSGGRLLDDMDAGYGLEMFLIDGEQRSYPYRVEVGYYGRSSGYGTGKVQVVEHDGQGQLSFDDRPFIVLKQRGYVDLGVLPGPLAPAGE